MRLTAIRYTAERDQMTAFYAALGLIADIASRTGNWIQLASSTGTLALHVAGRDKPAGAMEVAFEAEEPLEGVKARLDAAGFPGSVIVDESHGRSLRITDPEDVPLQINESDPELFT